MRTDAFFDGTRGAADVVAVVAALQDVDSGAHDGGYGGAKVGFARTCAAPYPGCHPEPGGFRRWRKPPVTKGVRRTARGAFFMK